MLADDFLDSVDGERRLVFVEVTDFDNARLIYVVVPADGHVDRIADSKRLVVRLIGVVLVTALELHFAQNVFALRGRDVVGDGRENFSRQIGDDALKFADELRQARQVAFGIVRVNIFNRTVMADEFDFYLRGTFFSEVVIAFKVVEENLRGVEDLINVRAEIVQVLRFVFVERQSFFAAVKRQLF